MNDSYLKCVNCYYFKPCLYLKLLVFIHYQPKHLVLTNKLRFLQLMLIFYNFVSQIIGDLKSLIKLSFDL